MATIGTSTCTSSRVPVTGYKTLAIGVLLLLTTTTILASKSIAFVPNILQRIVFHRVQNPSNSFLILANASNKDASTEMEKDDSIRIKSQTYNPFRLAVLRLGLTEPSMTSPLNYGKYDGTFACAYCGHELFDSTAKYDSGSGWPSFWRSLNENSISYKMEGDGRLECRCKNCSSHLGHLFLDGPLPSTVASEVLKESPASDPRAKTKPNLPRFCINGAALNYNQRNSEK